MRHQVCGIGKPEPTMRYERHYRILRYSKVLGVAVHVCISDNTTSKGSRGWRWIMEGTESFPTRLCTTDSSPFPFPLFTSTMLQDTDQQGPTQPEGDLLRELGYVPLQVGLSTMRDVRTSPVQRTTLLTITEFEQWGCRRLRCYLRSLLGRPAMIGELRIVYR